jgi:hypothetical protein
MRAVKARGQGPDVGIESLELPDEFLHGHGSIAVVKGPLDVLGLELVARDQLVVVTIAFIAAAVAAWLIVPIIVWRGIVVKLLAPLLEFVGSSEAEVAEAGPATQASQDMHCVFPRNRRRNAPTQRKRLC